METEPLVKIPGAELAARRGLYGVTRNDLAAQMHLHRNTLRQWENDPEVDVLRQRRYMAALLELVAERSPAPRQDVSA